MNLFEHNYIDYNLLIYFLAYLSSNCHVEIVCCERPITVKKEVNTNAPAKVLRSVNVRTQVRKATAAALRKRKYVQVGSAKN